MDKEEGEMSDDAMMVDDEDIITTPLKENDDSGCTMIYKADKNGVLIEKLEKVDAVKLEERAKRFGLNLSGSRLVTQKQIDDLYSKAGIEGDNERHFRFDTLHLNGIDGLTTREIFEYLEDYKPVSMEKVDDTSCNIICQDHIAAALALLVHSREIRNGEIQKMLADKSSHHWREGMPHPKKDLILMRFATNGDKKLAKKKSSKNPAISYYDESMDSVSKNPWGDLCQSWGVYDHQEIFRRKLPKNDYGDEIEEPRDVLKIKNKQLAKRLGKRTHYVEDSDDSTSDAEWKQKPKTPRMRMHADDEESKQKKKKPVSDILPTEKDTYAPLSIEVVNTRSSYIPKETTKLSDKFKSNLKSDKKDSIHSRLGIKQECVDETLAISEDELSDNSDHNVMSRVQKVNSNSKSSSSVWDRLESNSKTSKTDAQSDLRQILKSKKISSSGDLRDRISKSKKSNLRIEIDNN